MKAFTILVLVCTAIDIAEKLTYLGGGYIPERTPRLLAWDAGINVVLFVFGALALKGAL